MFLDAWDARGGAGPVARHIPDDSRPSPIPLTAPNRFYRLASLLLAAGCLSFSSPLGAAASLQKAPADQQNGNPQSQGQKSPAPQSTAPPAKPNDPGMDAFHAQQSLEIGEFYLRKGDPAAAADRFKYAIKLKPNFAKPRIYLARISEKEGDNTAAIRYYQEYLKILPNAPDAKKIQKHISELQAADSKNRK
jgi:tetratricopeptide (TPR) repeat protein